MIARAAGTVKSIVAPEVFEAGIVMTNAAHADAIPAAEFTLSEILIASKNVLGFARHCSSSRNATQPAQLTDRPAGNWHKTVGIVGVSRIGRRVIALPKPLDLTVLAHDPYLDAAKARASGVEKLELEAMIAQSDVPTLHAPALQATRHTIDARCLALMRDGDKLINTARGSVVDHAALARELVSGGYQR